MHTITTRTAQATEDGAGVKIRRINDFTGQLDPFLMVDELKSAVKDDYIGGFPPHPHRGFETLTYLLHGGLQHRDSEGHQGGVDSGGAQWMRAGRGVVHSEMPTTDSHGLHGFQVWINLPATLKMSEPAYRDLQGDDIPELSFPGGSARLIADQWTFNDQTGQGALTTLADGAGMADLRLEPGVPITIRVRQGFRLLGYVYAGAVQDAAGQIHTDGQLLVFPLDAERVELTASGPAGILLLAGQPLGEPIAHRGPFVMNTQAEIQQAIHDYQSGQMGTLS